MFYGQRKSIVLCIITTSAILIKIKTNQIDERKRKKKSLAKKFQLNIENRKETKRLKRLFKTENSCKWKSERFSSNISFRFISWFAFGFLCCRLGRCCIHSTLQLTLHLFLTELNAKWTSCMSPSHHLPSMHSMTSIEASESFAKSVFLSCRVFVMLQFSRFNIFCCFSRSICVVLSNVINWMGSVSPIKWKAFVSI